MKKRLITPILVACVLASGCGGESGKSPEPETVAESEKDEKPDSKEQKEESNQDKSGKEAKNKESTKSKKKSKKKSEPKKKSNEESEENNFIPSCLMASLGSTAYPRQPICSRFSVSLPVPAPTSTVTISPPLVPCR